MKEKEKEKEKEEMRWMKENIIFDLYKCEREKIRENERIRKREKIK